MHILKTQTDKLIVGTNDVSYTAPDTSPTGTTVLNGPVYVGKPTASPGYDAVFNVGTPPPPQQPFDTQPPLSASLGIKLDGSMEIVGDGRVPNALKISGGQTNKLFVDGDAFFSGAVDCGNKGKLAARFGSADARPKPFDLVHPTKGEGHRLRYACIEGPEVGVYYRGRLKESNVIELPYYWNDLVDDESITVNLTSIGVHQNLCYTVVREDKLKVIVNPHSSRTHNIRCSYTVFAERKDVSKLVTEYEGRET